MAKCRSGSRHQTFVSRLADEEPNASATMKNKVFICFEQGQTETDLTCADQSYAGNPMANKQS